MTEFFWCASPFKGVQWTWIIDGPVVPLTGWDKNLADLLKEEEFKEYINPGFISGFGSGWEGGGQMCTEVYETYRDYMGMFDKLSCKIYHDPVN